MTGKLFGTDGIRARFGEEPLTRATVRRLGLALGRKLRGTADGEPPLVLLGGDTRASTPLLVEWMTDGLQAAGARTVDLGILPTPAVAWSVPRSGAAAGVVASASHNPAEDNGLKLIDAAGFKWSTEAEARLEGLLAVTEAPESSDGQAARTSTAGAADPLASRRYLRWLVGEAGGRRALAGLRVALDAANGAAATIAGELFSGLGASVELLFSAPDGQNINRDCGSTHPAALAARLATGEFDLGFAFDGDADRALLLDERGTVHDGDAMLYLWARDLHQRGQLVVPKIVATSMSNLGLECALRPIGVEVVRCDVGDRAVVATLRANGLRLGGEQSGHLVDLHCSTTGDGLLTAVRIAVIGASAARAGRTISAELAGFRRFPQILVNVRVTSKPPFAELSGVAAAARRVEAGLGTEGRLVLRYSGTEPLARIMIEGPDESSIGELAGVLADAIRQEIGAVS
ncbi:MAG: Phosphoglucosamine mutase [Acidobacteriota bacterium]|nr:Phosphoglucosamine mutase [Acidobacteriota bacterium]